MNEVGIRGLVGEYLEWFAGRGRRNATSTIDAPPHLTIEAGPIYDRHGD